jgi:hypothetical protein
MIGKGGVFFRHKVRHKARRIRPHGAEFVDGFAAPCGERRVLWTRELADLKL